MDGAQVLETILPQSLGRLAAALGAARERLRERFPDAGARRQVLDAALGEGGAIDPLREDSADRLADWLEGTAPPGESGFVEIRMRSADPEDLTLREARLLGSADVLAYEPGTPDAILDRARADAARVALVPGTMPVGAAGLVVILRS